jgi:hypothetical protein
MILYLGVHGGRFVAGKQPTVGCGPTAWGSILTEMIAGMSVAECRDRTVENLVGALDGVPPDKLHGSAFAIGALKGALAKWPDPRKGTE